MTRALALSAALFALAFLWLFAPTGRSGSVTFHTALDSWSGANPPTAAAMARRLADSGAVRSPLTLRLAWRAGGWDTALHWGPVSWTGREWGWQLASLLAEYRSDTVLVRLYPGESPLSAANTVCGAAFGADAMPACAAGALPISGDISPDDYLIDRVGLVARAGAFESAGANRREALVFAAFGPLVEYGMEAQAEMLSDSHGSLSLALAGLVEAEAALDSERARIAGVIQNRLAAGMRLQIDASALYCLELAGLPRPGRVLREHLRQDCPFNTYLHAGLPPGPIALPGRASLEAAIAPEEHDYLYYVLDGAGPGHLFARTYEEHLVNVEASRARREEP